MKMLIKLYKNLLKKNNLTNKSQKQTKEALEKRLEYFFYI